MLKSARSRLFVAGDEGATVTRVLIAEFFGGLDLVEPGIVAVSDWRPEPDDSEHPTPMEASIFGAVGRKP